MALWLVQSVLLFAASDADSAYSALKSQDYDSALLHFRKSLATDPTQAKLRQDFAYTLLKTGDTEEARDQFAKVLETDPANEHLALEYAYLCFETRKPVDARRTFARLAKEAKDPKIRESAAKAFVNVDAPLAQGIDRWRKAVVETPNSFSAHQELAQLAEQRDELTLAAQHYEYAWQLRRDMRSFLLDLGRIWKAQQRDEQAVAALLAASRGAEPRAADKARALLPKRYPYLYEFQNALKLDDQNLPLRREYAYLLLEMGRKQEAEKEFQLITTLTPKDRIASAQLDSSGSPSRNSPVKRSRCSNASSNNLLTTNSPTASAPLCNVPRPCAAVRKRPKPRSTPRPAISRKRVSTPGISKTPSATSKSPMKPTPSTSA